MPDNPMCETCRFWKENPYYQEGENSPGWCRRYAPRPRVLMYDDDSTDTSMTEIMWPVVSDGDWCGEHAPRVKAAKGVVTKAMVDNAERHREDLERMCQEYKDDIKRRIDALPESPDASV